MATANNRNDDRNAAWWVLAGLTFTGAAAQIGRGWDLYEWWQPLVTTIIVASMLILVGWRRPAAVPACILIGTSLIGCGAFVAWIIANGWGKYSVWVLCLGGVIVAVVSLRLPAVGTLSDWIVDPSDPGDPRPRIIRDREAKIRRATKQNYVVTAVVPWKENPKGGERIYVDLPDGGTVDDLRADQPKVQAQLRLLRGCVASVLDGEHHQGEAVIDVMTRDVFSEDVPGDMDTDPMSITDSFRIGRNARGVWRYVCLRIESMIVGGSPGSGKTTLLRRIIMYLARCTDAVIWVIDMNGGGVAEPFVTPYIEGKAEKPAVDWVAANPYEAAVMLAGAREILKSRKRSPSCIAAKRAANTNVLPVSAKRPAIVIIGDEGAEVEELPGLIGGLVSTGITKVAEIGRSEAGRVVHSVLRGVANAIDKTLRVNARLRLCARMNEHGEYTHIIDKTPPKIAMRNKGMFWARLLADHNGGEDEAPDLELLRGCDVTPAQMEQHTIAVAKLRPELDPEARKVLDNLTLFDVLGLDPSDVDVAIRRHPAMLAVETGHMYDGRWDRYRAEIDEDGYGQPAPALNPYALDMSSVDEALEALHTDDAEDEQDQSEAADRHADDVADDPASDDGDERAGPVAQASARDAIETVMRDAYPEALESHEIGVKLFARGVRVSRQTRQKHLSALVRSGELGRAGGSKYVYLPKVGKTELDDERIYRPDSDVKRRIITGAGQLSGRWE